MMRAAAYVMLFSAAAAPAALLQAQASVTVEGRVVDRQGAPVPFAELQLNHRRVPAIADGSFRILGVPRGAVKLRARALGYDEIEIDFTANRDTTIVVVLTAAPIRIDGVEARVRNITVSGRVVDAERRLGVDATIYSHPGTAKANANGTGRYQLTNVPAGEGSSIIVEAFGYLPQRALLTTLADTSIDFTMEEDPVARAMMRRQLERLTARSSLLPYPTQTIRGDDMNHNGTLEVVLRTQFQITSARCVVLDEVIQWQEPDRKPRWRVLPSDDVHTIEVIDRGIGARRWSAGMLRIYTNDFVRRMAVNGVTLPDIVVRRGGNPIGCR